MKKLILIEMPRCAMNGHTQNTPTLMTMPATKSSD